jgi:hypothetical protein
MVMTWQRQLLVVRSPPASESMSAGTYEKSEKAGFLLRYRNTKMLVKHVLAVIPLLCRPPSKADLRQ